VLRALVPTGPEAVDSRHVTNTVEVDIHEEDV